MLSHPVPPFVRVRRRILCKRRDRRLRWASKAQVGGREAMELEKGSFVGGRLGLLAART